MMLNYGDMSGWSWWWMGPSMLIVLGVIVAVVVLAVRTSGGPKVNDPAMDTLRKRFASGEINQEEFEKGRLLLQG